MVRGSAWFALFCVPILTLGAAAVAAGSEPNIGHIGYCSVAGNRNPPTGDAIPPGTFLTLVAGQPLADPNYTGAYAANFVEAVGITCDAPPAGYVRQGFAPESLHVPGGVYPYFAPAPASKPPPPAPPPPASASEIAFVRDGSIYVIHPDGKGPAELKVVADGAPADIAWSNPTWSPDGTRLALVGHYANGSKGGTTGSTAGSPTATPGRSSRSTRPGSR